jgi:hypothetical protein
VTKWPITKEQQCGVIQYQNYISNFKVTFKLNLQFGAHTVSTLPLLQPPVCLEMVFKRRNLFFFSCVETCNDAALPLKIYPHCLLLLPLLHPAKLKQQHGFLSMPHHSLQPPLLSVIIK